MSLESPNLAKKTTADEVDVEEIPTAGTTSEAVVDKQQGGRVQELKPSDRVRAVFATAISSLNADKEAYIERKKHLAVAISTLNADKAAYNERKKNIAVSLKTSIREILREELEKRKRSTSVMTAVSALTSLGDSSNCLPTPEDEADAEEEDRKMNAEDAKTSINMTFPHKLLEILDDKLNENIITWLPHGKAFVIYQKEKFASGILPRYFKETKYTSFTRKLNRWGFERIKKGPEIGAYYHKHFQKGNHQRCMKMTCLGSKNDDKFVISRGEREESAENVPSTSLSIKISQQVFRSPESTTSTTGGNTVVRGYGLPFLQGYSADRTQQLRFLHQQRAAYASSPFELSHVDRLSQGVQVMNLQRGHTPSSSGGAVGHFATSTTQNQMMGNANISNSAASTSTNSISPRSMEIYSNAVVNAAIETLQRSFQMPQTTAPAPATPQSASVYKPFKPMFPSAAVLQQHIEQYWQTGIVHPELHSTLLQQQAAATAMFHIQHLQQQQQQHQLQQQQQQQQSQNNNLNNHPGFLTKRANAA